MFPKISPAERSCLNCKHFDFNMFRRDAFGELIKPLNRECLYGLDPSTAHTKPVELKWGRCQMWRDMRTWRQKLLRQLPQKGFC